MIGSLRWTSAACLVLASIFGASGARANLLDFGPSQGWSDSPYSLGGSLTYSGSTLTTWDLRATNGNSTVYEWTQANSTFITYDDGTTLTLSSDGTFTQSHPSVWLHSEGSAFPDMTGSANWVDWNFFVSWAQGGQYANAAAYFTGTPDAPTPTPEPASIALIGLGLAGLGFSRRRKAA